MSLFEALWKIHLIKIFMTCHSVRQIQDLGQSAKCGFSKKAFRRQYFFLFPYVLLTCYHHLRAKLGGYIALCIFLNFWQVWCTMLGKFELCLTLHCTVQIWCLLAAFCPALSAITCWYSRPRMSYKDGDGLISSSSHHLSWIRDPSKFRFISQLQCLSIL